MGFLSDLSRFAGNATGGLIGESDEERKRKEELKRQAQAQARAAVATPQTPKAPQQAAGMRVPAASLRSRPKHEAPAGLYRRDVTEEKAVDVFKTPQQRLKEQEEERQRKQVRPNGTVIDQRPLPGQVPGDAVAQANEALKNGQGLKDVGNYWKSDAEALRRELAKPQPNQKVVAGLTTSIKNRKGEIDRMNTTMSRDEREEAAKTAMEARGGKFDSGRTFVGDVAAGIGKSLVDTIGAPAATIAAYQNKDIINRQLTDLNERFKRGEISEGRMREEYAALTDGVIGNKTKATKDGIRQATAGEDLARFGGQFAETGVNAYVGGGTAVNAAARAGEEVVKQSVGAIVKNALKTGAKESAITGTVQTGADVAQDRGVSAESLLANYGLDAGLNVAGEAIGPLVRKLVTKENVKAATDAINKQLRQQGSTETVTPAQVEKQMTDELVAQAQPPTPAAEPVAPESPFVRDRNTPVTKNLIEDADGNLVRTDTGEVINIDPIPAFDNRIPRAPEPVAPAPKQPTTDELIKQADDAFAHEYNVEYHDRALEAERLKELVLDPATPDEQVDMLTRQIVEHRQRMEELQHLMNGQGKVLAGETPYETFKRMASEGATPEQINAVVNGAPNGVVDENDLAIDASGRYYKKSTGEYLPAGYRPMPTAAPVKDIDVPNKAEGTDMNVAMLSEQARNSLQNDLTGQKPGGVERSGGFVENGNAIPVEYRKLEDGSIHIVDGRHTLEYARQNGITDFPVKDVTEQYREPVTTASVVDRTAALPDSTKAGADDIPAIQTAMSDTNNHLDSFASATTPEQRNTLMKEIAEHDRSGAALSDESRVLYDEWIGPVVDALYDKSRRAGEMGRKDYYLPEEIAGTEAPEPRKYGNTWADEANMEFGHAKRREGKIDSDELNDPAVALKNYVQQFYQDNYGHLTPENIREAEGRGAVDGAAYLTGRRAVAEKLDASMVRSLTDKKAGTKNNERVKETLSIATDIRANADKTLTPESITELRGGLAGLSALRTNRKVADRIEGGNGQSAYQRFGMRQFENAESLANDAFGQNFTPGMSREEYGASLHAYYDALYQREFTDVMSPEKFHEYVETGVRRSYSSETAAPLARVEQDLAIEKAIFASEHIRYADKATQKYIDYEVGHMLRRGKMPSTLARTVANNVSRTFYSGALGLNPLSAIQNFTELSRVAGLTASGDTLKTLKAQITSAGPLEMGRTLDEYGIDSNRIRQEQADALATEQRALRFAGKFRDVTEDTVMAGFNATEMLKNFAMVKALEVKHADIADPRQRREAIMDDFNANSLIGGHYGNLVGVDRSNLMRVAMQFGTYTLRDWGQLADRAKAGDAGYVARVLGTKAALALPMYALFGTSLAYTLGINEFKGGPIVSLTTELINSVVEENNRVESETENGKAAEFDWSNVTAQFSRKATPLLVAGGNYLFNKLGVQELLPEDGDNVNLLRDDTFIGDQQRGYNVNKTGVPRFAAADGQDNPMSVIRGIMGGAYNTDEAREYFGKDFWAKPQLFGLFESNAQKHSPAYGRFQERIEGQSKILTNPNATKEQKDVARATIRNTFDKAYESQDLKNEFFTANPEAASIYKEMTKTTFNKATGKRESDIISPEKWKYVDSEKSGKLFEFLKNRAQQNHDSFGDPTDPIYTAKLTEAQRKEILNLRSSYTGDDKERKSMLYETEWYNQFAAQMSDYYDQMDKQTFAEDSDFGKSKRAQEYFDLSGKMPQKSDLYKQYQALRYGDSKTGTKGDEAAGKAFYKAHADQLTAEDETYKKAHFNWTNQMRVLEGATPLTWEQFDNDTYGYKSGGSTGSKYTKWGKSGGVTEKDLARTGANDALTNFAGKLDGPKRFKVATPDLVDVRKVVKQPSRANRKAPIRITI